MSGVVSVTRIHTSFTRPKQRGLAGKTPLPVPTKDRILREMKDVRGAAVLSKCYHQQILGPPIVYVSGHPLVLKEAAVSTPMSQPTYTPFIVNLCVRTSSHMLARLMAF